MLNSLLAGSLEDALAQEEKLSFAEVMKVVAEMPPPLDVLEILKPAEHIKLIAEVKRASPSRGDLAEIKEPAELAKQYEAGGASVISVLTEERRFKGSLKDLEEVREAVKIPVLRKDFIGNRYQIARARAVGADLILLIVAALDEETLRDLYDFTLQLGMTPLVETHTAAEVKLAVDLGAKLIGVNARNLKTFELDKDLFGAVQSLIPAGVIKVAESAVLSVADVQHYREAGADVVLVGEALATAPDPVQRAREFLI